MFIFSNLAISVDGKIATASRVHFPLGTTADRKQMHVLRRRSDAILMGASTLRAFQRFCFAEGAKIQPCNVILSSGLKGISPNWPFFKAEGVRRVLLVTGPVPVERFKLFEKTSEVIQLKKPSSRNPIGAQIVKTLDRIGVKRLLVEGGGSLMWDFVSQNLIDEYHITVTPRVLGGTEAPTLVDGLGFSPKNVVNLKMKQCRVVKDELYLVYSKTDRRGP